MTLQRPQVVSDHQSPSLRPRKRSKLPGPTFDAVPTEHDTRWTDLSDTADESHETRSGPLPDLLARTITKPCHPASDSMVSRGNHHFRCIASSVCGKAWKTWDRNLSRIYKHALRCSALRRWKPDLYAAAEVAYASMAPGGLRQSIQTPEAGSATPPVNPSHHSIRLPVVAPRNPFAQFDLSAEMSTKDRPDHALASLICASGSPARLADYPEWSEFLRLHNPQSDYLPPKSSYIRHRLIPTEARRAILHMREFLKGQTNISLSFDGLTAGQQPVYTIHVCTADRQTFLYHADVFYGSHNADYVTDLLQHVIEEIGPHRFASVVSDDTATTKKARRIASSKYTSILNLADPVHKLNLCIQDICRDDLWDEPIKQLRKLLTHFKMSTHASGKLNNARNALGIARGLQSIGKTRFATLYYAAVSVLNNLPALYKIYRDREIDTKGTPLPDIVADAVDESRVTALKFKQGLTELINVLEPFARALLCLESTRSTLSDVYFYWLGALASLNYHFRSRNCLLTQSDKSRFRQFASRRFNEAINDAPTDIYMTAFFLDPRFRSVAIYAHSQTKSLLENGNATTQSLEPYHSLPQRLSEDLYIRIRKQLFSMLRAELEMAENLPSHPLHLFSQDALLAKEQLREQLDWYYRAEQRPFGLSTSPNETAIQFWRSQKSFEQTFLLSYLAEKIFAILPNSMCDERAGSRLTHLYSTLRTRLDAQSMIEQVQFTQWTGLVKGTQLTVQQKKLPSLLRFTDIPSNRIPQNQVSGDSVEHTIALEDVAGDQWLDNAPKYATSAPESDPTPLPTMPGEDHIDLTSEVLLNILCVSAGTENAVDSSFNVKSEESDQSPTSTAEESPIRVIRRARDISWD